MSERWSPRVQRETGRPGFVKLADDLALAMMAADLTSWASGAVLLAIFWRHQRTYRGLQPVPITVRDLCENTGLARATVHRALRELIDRDLVLVTVGGGRGRASSYQVAEPAAWSQKGSHRSDPLIRKGSHRSDRLGPERVSRRRSETDSPLSIPLRENKKVEVEEVELREQVSEAHVTRLETVPAELVSTRNGTGPTQAARTGSK